MLYYIVAEIATPALIEDFGKTDKSIAPYFSSAHMLSDEEVAAAIAKHGAATITIESNVCYIMFYNKSCKKRSG